MAIKNVFDENVANELIGRIDSLNKDTKPVWGKMNVAQMMAHCSVTYDTIYENSSPPAKGLKKFFLKTFIKGIVVGEKPYKRNGRTAPDYLIADERDFAKEKEKLKNYLLKAQQDGPVFYEGKESHSFGKLTIKEWNNMFYKHLDHHLTQFDV